MTTSVTRPPVTHLLDNAWERSVREPAYGAYVLLHIGYVVLPLWMGIDKFVKVLNPDWPHYLAPWIVNLIPFSAQTAMYVVGAIEILAAARIRQADPAWKADYRATEPGCPITGRARRASRPACRPG